MGASIKFIVKRSVGVAGTILSALPFILSLWSWEELGVVGYNKAYILVAVVLLSIIVALVCTAISKRKKEWQQGNASIGVLYGDMIKIGFPKKSSKKGKCIVVIPVNTHFDTIVNDEIVALSSLHGQWINRLCYNGETADSINNKIKHN